MDEIPLLNLTHNDPERLLSEAARRRISKAKFESESIRMRAAADARFEFERAGKPSHDFTRHRLTSPAYREAVLESIRAVLRVQCREFGALNISSRRFREILRDEIEGAVRSAQNHDEPVGALDQRALEIEVFSMSYAMPAEPGANKKATSGAAGGRPKAVAINSEKVRALRGEASQKTFCRFCKISADRLQKAERGSATEQTILEICKYAAKNGQNLTTGDLKIK